MPAPETILLHAVSDDARWLLITASSDRLGADDRNGAADVFVLDRTTGTATLISTDADGHSGNGTSLAGGMSADGSRVVFQTRASNLISNDGNRTWDVLIRDLTTGTNGLANLAVGGTNSTGPATEPRLSADGRYVVFISPARDLAPGACLPGVNLYRRDLLDGPHRGGDHRTPALPRQTVAVGRLRDNAGRPGCCPGSRRADRQRGPSGDRLAQSGLGSHHPLQPSTPAGTGRQRHPPQRRRWKRRWTLGGVPQPVGAGRNPHPARPEPARPRHRRHHAPQPPHQRCGPPNVPRTAYNAR